MRWSRVMGLTSLFLLLIPSFGIALAADVINVRTGKSYEPGEEVEVEGNTNVTGTVTVIITNSSGYEIWSSTVDPEDGEFSVGFTLDEDFPGGIYEVNATVGNIYNTTSFEVVVEDDGDGANVHLEGEETGEEDMTLEELLCAIDRAFRFIEKANATAEALHDGYDMTLLWEKVNGLNGSLTELLYNITQSVITLEEAVEEFRGLRKEISQLSGLLNSITKNVKEDKAKQFAERMMRRIEGLEENIPMLGASAEVDEFASALRAHQRKLERLWLTLNTTISPTELEEIMKELEGVTEGVDSGLNGLGDKGYTLKEMYKLQARIEVFNATVERMKAKNKTMRRLEEKLGNAKLLMEQMVEQFGELTKAELKTMIETTNEELGGVGRTIREMNKQNNGGNGKSKGNQEGN